MRTYFVPKISLKDHIVILIIFSFVGALMISALAKISPGKESALVGIFVYITFLIYYYIMLFRGVRYDTGIVKWQWHGLKPDEMLEMVNKNGIDVGPIKFESWDFGDDLFGIVIAFILSLIVYFVFLIIVLGLAWLGINLAGYVMYLAWIPLYALVRYGMRLSLSNVRKSKGNLSGSLYSAALHALIPAISISIFVYAVEKLVP